ncbi:universal stress protein [Catellatospora tritici]|uniref:universal stress protein n=1 Tax=Catellatospora tritici TaxID=2851566 RepID=UPI001C2D46D4|nr:universal stress protein [Catellatospora tritici]MBV1853087.1 universal stress protein [Catellatospora tritici]
MTNNALTTPPVLVGYDDSRAGRSALELAAAEAAARSLPLCLLYRRDPMAWTHPTSMAPYPASFWRSANDDEQAAHAAAEAVQQRFPQVEVRLRGTQSSLPQALAGAAPSAAMLVVGGAAKQSALPSRRAAGVRLARKAGRPVLSANSAVPSDAAGSSQGPVVVAAAGSQVPGSALSFAFEEAAAYGVDVLACGVWHDRGSADAFSGAVRATAAEHPEVAVRQVTLGGDDHAAHVPVLAEARLMVLGGPESRWSPSWPVPRELLRDWHRPIATVPN